MKEILLVSLTRFGDLIQATPLLRGLKIAHPGARITLAVEKHFTGILPLIRGYDRVFVFDKTEAARRISCSDDPLAAYRHMEGFISLLEQEQYDMIINLTSDRMSAYLVSALNTPHVSGITAADNGQRVISGMWGTYLFSVLLGDNRKYNRINLVDNFTKMGGLPPDGLPVELQETEEGKRFADGFIEQEGLSGVQLIGIQLGASDPTRCWPAESFARLADRLQERPGVRTVFFGSPGERRLADQAASIMRSRPVNAVGRTGIEELFSLVRRCSFLVTNDTGTMHFAAAGGTPVVMLSLGPASFLGTGPYSAGNLALQPKLPCSPCRYIFECHDPVCRTVLSVDTVHNACRLMLGNGVAGAGDFPGVGVYRSLFGPDGFLEWEGLYNADSGQEELTGRYALLWKHILDGEFPPKPEQRHPLAAELEGLSARGMKVTADIMNATRQKPIPLKRIASLGEEEAALETEIKLLGSCDPTVAPVVDFLTLMRENICNDDLYAIASRTHRLYTQGQRLAAHL